MTPPTSQPLSPPVLALPKVVVDAGRLLNAPVDGWGTAEQVFAWAESGLSTQVACGATRHRVRVRPQFEWEQGGDPAAPAPASEGERARMDAAHMLWALQQDRIGTPPPCFEFGMLMVSWVGPTRPRGPHRWASGARHERVLALRTLCRTVEYLHAGLDLPTYEKWIRLGIDPSTLGWMRDRLAAHGRREDEEDLLAVLEDRTGVTGATAEHGGYVSDTAWLASVFQHYIGFAGPTVPVDDATPARLTETIDLSQRRT